MIGSFHAESGPMKVIQSLQLRASYKTFAYSLNAECHLCITCASTGFGGLARTFLLPASVRETFDQNQNPQKHKTR
eukprot:477556-Amphidinium_carterae.1